MHVLPAKHSYAWLPRVWLPHRQTDTRTDRCRTKWSLCAAMLFRRHNNEGGMAKKAKYFMTNRHRDRWTYTLNIYTGCWESMGETQLDTLTFSYPAQLQLKMFVFHFIMHNVNSVIHVYVIQHMSNAHYVHYDLSFIVWMIGAYCFCPVWLFSVCLLSTLTFAISFGPLEIETLYLACILHLWCLFKYISFIWGNSYNTLK